MRPARPADGLLHNLVRANFLAGLQSNGLSGRTSHFLSGSRISSHAAFAWLHNKSPEASKFDSLSSFQRILERSKNGLHRYLCPDFGNVQLLSDTIHDVLFDHAEPSIS